jgi:transposase
MTERAVELVPDLIRGQARDGRCKYDPSAKVELVRRCLQPGGNRPAKSSTGVGLLA